MEHMQYFKINGEQIPVNWQPFVLSYSRDPEEYGMDEDYVREILELEANCQNILKEQDAETLNNVGLIFESGIGCEADIKKAVYWYQLAVEKGDYLAMSNLADILRKGTGGIKINYPRAFELYKACGLPYGHYRVGEFYEKGWGVEKNLSAAKEYYRLAYQEAHPLARKKLNEWNFLED